MNGKTFISRVDKLNPKDAYFIVFMLYCMLKKEGKILGHFQEKIWQETLNYYEFASN